MFESKSKTFACAHRGDSSRFRENTIVAIQSAIDAGAEVVEIDVRITRDGKVIQAVILLNQDATPAQIMQAATDLDMAAQAGMVEARYWRARIAIAQQGPLYNPRQGMEAMRQAAEQGTLAVTVGADAPSPDAVRLAERSPPRQAPVLRQSQKQMH